MNNRDYKQFSRDTISHIYNRGNNKEKIFFDEQDYKAFLFRLGLALSFSEKELNEVPLLAMPYSRIRITAGNKQNFKLHSFCLMPNHFHLIIEQIEEVSVSNLISKLSTSYSKYINNKYKKIGHVFQDKFKAVLIDTDSQLMWTSAYIHMNPVKDGLVREPENYKWSSYLDYINERNLIIVHTDFVRKIFGKGNFKKETQILSSNSLYVSKTVFDTYNFVIEKPHN